MGRRYTLGNFLDALNRPRLLFNEIRRIVDYPSEVIWNRYFQTQYGDGIDIIERDWDNLLVLDACRYDFFKDQNSIDGDLSSVVSAGEKSWPFLHRNFSNRKLHDIVYVSANPFVERLDDEIFHATWSLLDRWTEDPGTVLPETVVDAALEASETYPNKRLIVHFMQPHRPYLGPTADEIRENIRLSGWGEGHTTSDGSTGGVSLWNAAKCGQISKNKIRTAYRETLDLVLEQVFFLLESLDGRSVVTADHGEMLGESVLPHTRPIYGHSTGVQSRQLRIVPWLDVPATTRREIVAEPPVAVSGHNKELVSKRLRELGYA